MSQAAEKIGAEKLAEIAFVAYSAKAGGKTWDGKDIPPFSEVGEKVQSSWLAAVSAVVDALNKEVAK